MKAELLRSFEKNDIIDFLEIRFLAKCLVVLGDPTLRVNCGTLGDPFGDIFPKLEEKTVSAISGRTPAKNECESMASKPTSCDVRDSWKSKLCL